MGGSKLLLGGGVGASHTQGHWGPGLQTLPDWPALTDPADTVLPLDRQLANYDQAESPITPVVNARRASDYSCFNYADHYLATTVPEGGYWNGSLDRLAGCAWVETATKHGLVYFGVKATGRSTYGDNPISITAMAIDTLTRSGTTATLTMVSDHGSTVPFSTGTSVTITNASPAGWNGTYVVTKTGATTFTFTCDGSLTTPAGRFDTSISIYAQGWDTNVLADLRDPSIGTPNSNHGYKSESFEGVVYAFDPAQLIDVSQGRRSKYSDGINPSLLGNWNTHWPNLPPWQGLDIGSTTNASQTRLVADNVSNRVFWDSTAQELIWVQPQSATSGGSRATVNRFTIAS
jgi:hypothetical protein